MGTKMTRRVIARRSRSTRQCCFANNPNGIASLTLAITVVVLLISSPSWAIKPLRGDMPSGEEGSPPEKILEVIEKEKEMKEEVIQRRKEKELEESPKEIVAKKPVPAPKTISKTPPITPIITALIILLIAFYIYRKR